MSTVALLFTEPIPLIFLFFFFNDTATTEIYTLSLHDALPILTGLVDRPLELSLDDLRNKFPKATVTAVTVALDRKSTRLNSSHGYISYAVFCLKKKKKNVQLYRLKHHTISVSCIVYSALC